MNQNDGEPSKEAIEVQEEGPSKVNTVNYLARTYNKKLKWEVIAVDGTKGSPEEETPEGETKKDEDDDYIYM